MAKHVIFLGAGASVTSGYPLAVDLRLLLSSPVLLRDYVHSKTNDYELAENVQKEFAKYQNVLKLFREGGFGTIDEFSFLSSGQFTNEIQNLKRFISLIFALHNPEDSYPKTGAKPEDKPTTAFVSSDYYPFIQKLFDADLHELKGDVAILTYNYDPYLEFVLDRAYHRRKQAVKGKTVVVSATQIKSLYDSSTFFCGFTNRNTTAVLERPGFCLLKLHGTSVLPNYNSADNQFEIALTHEDIFPPFLSS